MKYDVIICGAGPVGLFLAAELALAKCRVLVLEKAASPNSILKRLPFGIRGLSAPTIEAFDRRGLLTKLELHKRLKNPHQGMRQAGHFAGLGFEHANIDAAKWSRLPDDPPLSLISEMEEIEKILTAHAEELGVEIKRGEEVQSFELHDAGITVNGCQAAWLVGCDGARSSVRKLGGFEFAGTDPKFTGYSVQADIDGTLKSGRNMTAKGMYLHSQPGFVVIQDFDGGAFHGQPITRDHVEGVLRRVSESDVHVTKLHAATTWTDRARQTTQYRRGRILLAGDAAHIHAPLGGQGLNLGLGDAMNLGWKLAAVVHGADESLLDTYEKERHPLGLKVLDWSRAQVAIMNPSPEARALNAIFRDLIATKDGATYFAGRVWGVHTQYDLGGEHPLVGKSVPNFELADGTKLNDHMRDGRAILLAVHDHDLDSRRDEKLLRAKTLQNIVALRIRPDGYVNWVKTG